MKYLNEAIKFSHSKYYMQFFNTGSMIISGIYNFPHKICRNDTILSTLPRAIMMNKHIYEEILSLLQLHPCLIKMIIDYKNKKDLHADGGVKLNVMYRLIRISTKMNPYSQ